MYFVKKIYFILFHPPWTGRIEFLNEQCEFRNSGGVILKDIIHFALNDSIVSVSVLNNFLLSIFNKKKEKIIIRIFPLFS